LTAHPPASIKGGLQIERLIFNLILRWFAAGMLFRLRRKSVKKTEEGSVKKFSLFDDPDLSGEEFGKF